MKVDSRGRVRFSYTLYAPYRRIVSLRVEVGPKGTANITARGKLWGEDAVGAGVYRRLMGDPQFIEKLAKAQKEARRAGNVRALLRNYELMGAGNGAAER